jgi:hypothetical protein
VPDNRSQGGHNLSNERIQSEIANHQITFTEYKPGKYYRQDPFQHIQRSG